MSDELLKSFIIYCQSVETAYQEWKNYWLNYYMSNKGKDLYKEFNPMDIWSKNLRSD